MNKNGTNQKEQKRAEILDKNAQDLQKYKNNLNDDINQLKEMRETTSTLEKIGGSIKADDLIAKLDDKLASGFIIGDSIIRDKDYHIDIAELDGPNSLLKLELQAVTRKKDDKKPTYAQVNFLNPDSALVLYRKETTITDQRKVDIQNAFKEQLIQKLIISKQTQKIQVIVPQLVFDDNNMLSNITFQAHEIAQRR